MSNENSFPGVEVNGSNEAAPAISGVETSVTAFIGRTPKGAVNEATTVLTFVDFEREFGELDFNFPVTVAVRDFFQNGGMKAVVVRLSKDEANGPLDVGAYLGDPSEMTGINALLGADIFNLLSIPPDLPGGDVPLPVYHAALLFCVEHNAMLLVDPPAAWSVGKTASAAAQAAASGLESLGFEGPSARNAALYFPRVIEIDPATGQKATVVPSGLVAGIMASTDNTRGVWKAPAGIKASLIGIEEIELMLTDNDNGLLNPLGINTLRSFPVIGKVVWGARTLRGADIWEDDYKYVPVLRLSLCVEESIKRGLKWTVFEPNDEVLWASIRLTVTNFMTELLNEGAFYNFFVQCDATTTTQPDIDQGITNVQIGFAPTKPAEFVVLLIQLMAIGPNN